MKINIMYSKNFEEWTISINSNIIATVPDVYTEYFHDQTHSWACLSIEEKIENMANFFTDRFLETEKGKSYLWYKQDIIETVKETFYRRFVVCKQ